MEQEELNLRLTEWYDGNIICEKDENRHIELQQHSPDLVIEEIKTHIPNHFSWVEDEESIKKWIEDNRDATHKIYDDLLIGDTDTHDVQGGKQHFSTFQYSGTQYELEHNIPQDVKDKQKEEYYAISK